jgi:ParB family chromosome partitioning protein
VTAMIERALQLVDINPSDLIVGANVRRGVHLDEEFVASVRERGVLEPIVAFRDTEDQLVVLYGKRRTLAAVEAGLEVVDVVVVLQPDDADRLVDQLVENDHRTPLTNAERAAAYQQLAAIGLSEFEMAKRTAAPVETVAAAIEVAGSKAASAAIAEQPALTLLQAAGIAEFDHAPELVTELVNAANTSTSTFDHRLQRLRDDRDQAQRYDEKKAELEQAGETVVAAPGPSGSTAKCMRLQALADGKGKPITEAKHRKCPGRAVFLQEEWNVNRRTGWTPVEVCTDVPGNGHRWIYASSAGTLPAAEQTPEARELATAARREVIENNKAWAAAEPVRRDWLKAFIGRKAAPKGAAMFVLAALTARSDSTVAEARTHTGNRYARELLGVADYTFNSDRDELADLAAAAATDARALMLVLTIVLAAYEAATDREAWRTAKPATARYLRFLEANGYSLSEVELLACTKAEASA